MAHARRPELWCGGHLRAEIGHQWPLTEHGAALQQESVRLRRERLAESARKTKSRRSTVGTTTRKTALLTMAQVIPLVNAATRHVSTTVFNGKVGIIGGEKPCSVSTLLQDFGTNINFKTKSGYNNTRMWADSLDNVKTYARVLTRPGGRQPWHRLHRRHLPLTCVAQGDIFLLRGGQSYNPYEGWAPSTMSRRNSTSSPTERSRWNNPSYK